MCSSDFSIMYWLRFSHCIFALRFNCCRKTYGRYGPTNLKTVANKTCNAACMLLACCCADWYHGDVLYLLEAFACLYTVQLMKEFIAGKLSDLSTLRLAAESLNTSLQTIELRANEQIEVFVLLCWLESLCVCSITAVAGCRAADSGSAGCQCFLQAALPFPSLVISSMASSILSCQ